MGLEGKQEKKVNEFVYCAGIRGNVVKGTCERCEFYGGIRKEPIRQIKGNKEVEVIGLNEYILCKYPKLEKIHTLYEMEE